MLRLYYLNFESNGFEARLKLSICLTVVLVVDRANALGTCRSVDGLWQASGGLRFRTHRVTQRG